MAETIVNKRPIDAFIEYFNDVKPYHAKILEVVEKYNFYDDINVSIEETISNSINITTKALCKGVGFGLEWDDPECGYDAVECCTLGTCEPDPTTFTGLTKLATLPIYSLSQTEGKISVQGNFTFDITAPIKRILTKDSFTISGDITDLLNVQPMFFIVDYDTLEYIFNSTNSIKLSGNYAQQFINKRTFTIYGSNRNDGEYHVVSANYTPATNITTIIVAETMFINDFGRILIATKTSNGGFYTVVSSNFNGSDTTVFIDVSQRSLIIEDKPSSILMKTGFKTNRVINVSADNPNGGDYLIVDSKYNYSNNTTDIYLINQLVSNDSTGSVALKISTNANAYVSDINCKPPKENNLSVNFAEQLSIQVTKLTAPTPQLAGTAMLSTDNSGYWEGELAIYDNYCNHTYSTDTITSINVQWYSYNALPNSGSITTTTDNTTCMTSSSIDPSYLINSGSFVTTEIVKYLNSYSAPIRDELLLSTLNGLSCQQAVHIVFEITTDSGKTTSPDAVQSLFCV